MENWGLITYRMTAILFDPERSSSHDEQWISMVVAHELAHQVLMIWILSLPDRKKCVEVSLLGYCQSQKYLF
jgi:predicted SprT family Zn-dependent metalloprotease